MNLLLISDENKTHYVYIKDFNRFMFNNTKYKNKKHICRYCLQCFSNKTGFQEHKEICLEINGKQSVELRSGSIKFKNHFKQLAAPFKIYVDTECILEKTHINDRDKNTSYTEKHQHHISCSFVYKVVCIDDKFSKSVALYREENEIYKLIEPILKEYDYCKQIIKKSF